jgi:hypothetical protein
MARLVFGGLLLMGLVSWGACSDLGSAEGGSGGGPADGGGWFDDPIPATETLTLACASTNFDPQPVLIKGRLVVNPGPIVGGEPFAAQLNGDIIIPETVVDQSLSLVSGGYKRANLLELHALVHVRTGITGDSSEDFDMMLTNPFVEGTCTYDSDGKIGPTAGPFPSCSPDLDEEDGNRDCTGLYGAPHPDNRCGQFFELPTSDNFEECAKDPARSAEYRSYGFCLTGDFRIPLESSVQGYVAAGSGDVLFGWAEQSSLALEVPEFDAPTGALGFRALLGGVEQIGLECTMVARDSGPSGLLPTPDSELISFAIQAR